jgi:hypothetical protein
MLIPCNEFKGVNPILLIDLFPVHWLTHVLHHCIAVPLSGSKSKVHIIMETDCLQKPISLKNLLMLCTRLILYFLCDHHLLIHTTSTHKKCIGILCNSHPSCKSSRNWKYINHTILCSIPLRIFWSTISELLQKTNTHNASKSPLYQTKQLANTWLP